jgi:hypothetical protein
MYSCFNTKNIFINSANLMTFKIKSYNIKLTFLPLTLSFLLLFILFFLNLSFNYNSIYVYGHTLFGNSNNNGIQIQTNGKYKVGLVTSPPTLVLNKTINILLTVNSTTGDKIMELPAYISLQKDGKVVNSPNTLIMIDGGHYNFKTFFPQTGKYLLFVNLKDIYYTNSLINFIFVLDVNVPLTDQFYNLIKSFFINYYYIYIPIAILISIFFLRSHKKNDQEKITLIVRWLYKKLHK